MQKRTDQAKMAIENQLGEMMLQGCSIRNQVGQYASGVASQAGEACEEGYDLAAQKLSDRYKQASHYAKDNPGVTVAILLGSGILAGLGVAMVMRRK